MPEPSKNAPCGNCNEPAERLTPCPCGCGRIEVCDHCARSIRANVIRQEVRRDS